MKLFGKKLKTGFIVIMAISTLGSNCQKNTSGPAAPPPSVTKTNVDMYLTTPDKLSLLALHDSLPAATANQFPTITIDRDTRFQTMDGFGFALTGGSAFHIYNMSASKRSALLQELFGHSGSSIGLSYLRISIGASDLDAEVFSYDDLPAGETDPEMAKFSIAPDEKWLIPVIKEILTINPQIKIMGSPWSAPAWMKTNANSKGGSLKPEYFDAYSKYFVKYIQAMAARGITIDAVTIQNEPLYDGNNPSMYMTAQDQAVFIKNNLGPAFANAAIATKIVIYDHNADRTDYPLSILNDPEARKYVDGSAFHLYGGDISSLSQVHNAYPDKNLYFTEQWEGAPGNMAQDFKWSIRELIVGATRNWCKVVLQWNLASNSALEPHTPGGCTQCLGAVTIDGDAVVRNPVYYAIAQASKFVPQNSVRIASTTSTDLPNTAFLRPDGKIVIIVLNNTDNAKTFNLSDNKQTIITSLPAGAAASYVWN